jgi:hypothetical protein
MLTVSGPEALPSVPMAERRQLTYIVSDSDARMLIAGRTGEVFLREDGAAWEGDGYHVSEDVSGRKSWKFGNRIIGGKD